MASTWQFVDSISASPAVRLDLNGMAGGLMLAGQPDLSPPALNRVAVSSPLVDGERVPASAFRNRVIRMSLRQMSATVDVSAGVLQALARELFRPAGNVLRVAIGSQPMFFRTLPAPDAAYELLMVMPQRGQVTLEIPCEPFGYGPKETLPAVVVYNDPAEGTTLNSNPFFETDTSVWLTNAGEGSITRSTTQSHEGAASLLLTPDGVGVQAVARSVPVTGVAPGEVLRASAWLRCAVARSVTLRIGWRDAGGAFLSQSTVAITVAADTWTLFDVAAAAPASTAQASIDALMAGTPPATHLLHVDEARLRRSGGPGGMCFDITGPKGDVEAPLDLTFATGSAGLGAAGRLWSALSVRRRGTVSNTPFALQAEAMTLGTDTTLQADSVLMSGAGQNFVRVAPGTTAMVQRLSTTTRFPSTASVDARGTYRVFARVRQNIVADVWDMRLLYGSTGSQFTNDTVRLPPDTGPGAPTIKYVDLTPRDQLLQIPPGYDPVTDGLSGVELATEGVFLSVEAQRVSGTGTLDIDVLLFVSADDRLGLVKFPEIQAFSTDTFAVTGGPRFMAYCLNTAGQVSATQPFESTGGGLMITPGRPNRVFFLRDVGKGTAATGGGDVLGATTVVTGSYYPRYLFPLKPVST